MFHTIVRCRTQKEKFCNTCTYSPIAAQIASATLSNTSDPSSNMQSHTLSTRCSGKHVANNVRNHSIVNTLVSGGSYEFEPALSWAVACR